MLGRLLAGLVGVKTKHYFVDEAFQDPGLMIGEGGSLWRHDILNACFKQTNQIELAFTNNRAARFDQRAFRLLKSEQYAALLVRV